MDELTEARNFTLQVAERLYLAASVLAHLAERKPKGKHMTSDTSELTAKLSFMLDQGMRPSVALVREVMTTIQQQDEMIASLSARIIDLRLQLARMERDIKAVDV